MDTVDFVYRFDPKNPSLKPPPADAEAAKGALEEGNRKFSRWIRSCQENAPSEADEPFVVTCNGLEVGLVRKEDRTPRQAPFAVVVGCSDARVPVEMVFGQGPNNIFVVRVAGNVMGDVGQGSIDFALSALGESVKVVVVLGHTGCGAVTAAVDTYLEPQKFLSRTTTPGLRSIQERLFVAIREAANGLKAVWGVHAADSPGYRAALIEAAVTLNAAQGAYDLKHLAKHSAEAGVEAYFGVFSVLTNQVSMPVIPGAPVADGNVQLAPAPAKPEEIHALARRVAEILRCKDHTPAPKAGHAPTA